MKYNYKIVDNKILAMYGNATKRYLHDVGKGLRALRADMPPFDIALSFHIK